MNERIEAIVSTMLMEVGVSPSLVGYEYLKQAIILVFKDKTRLRKVTKLVYPEVALMCNTTSTRVERAIRHAVETLYNTSDMERISEYLGNTMNLHTGKVTNSTFIAGMAERMRINNALGGTVHES